MTKKSVLEDLARLQEMVDKNEYPHEEISALCTKYGLVPPYEEEVPTDQEEREYWIDPFEGIVTVIRVLANEEYYMNHTNRQYVLRGGVQTWWNGHALNNEDCDDATLADMLANGLDERFFLKYPGKE